MKNLPKFPFQIVSSTRGIRQQTEYENGTQLQQGRLHAFEIVSDNNGKEWNAWGGILEPYGVKKDDSTPQFKDPRTKYYLEYDRDDCSLEPWHWIDLETGLTYFRRDEDNLLSSVPPDQLNYQEWDFLKKVCGIS